MLGWSVAEVEELDASEIFEWLEFMAWKAEQEDAAYKKAQRG